MSTTLNRRVRATTAVAALIVAAASATAVSAQTVLKVGHVFAADHPWQIALEGLADDVREATGGSVEIQVFPSSQVGGDREMAESMQLGTLEMALFGTGALQVLDPRLIIEELPYAWPTREHAYAALDGRLGDALAGILSGRGIEVISWWESGYRHITNSVRPIETPEDMQGLTMRVPEAALRIDTFRQLGSLPTPMAFSEVFTALQQRVVDGQENPLATIHASRFYEVQEHLALSGHIWGSGALTIAAGALARLSDDERTALMEAAAKWRDIERQMIAESEERLVEVLAAAGVQITRPDPAAFQAAVQPVWDQYESVFGADLLELVREYSQQ